MTRNLIFFSHSHPCCLLASQRVRPSLQPAAQAEHARIKRQLRQHARAFNLRVPAAGYRVHVAELHAQADVGQEHRAGVVCQRGGARAFVDGAQRLQEKRVMKREAGQPRVMCCTVTNCIVKLKQCKVRPEEPHDPS